jgi:mono/diheme cytochrome c family protein
MEASLEIKAVGLAVIAGCVALGGALALSPVVRWISESNFSVTETTTATAASPALVAQGRHYFVMSCVECHGDDAHGDEGPDLHNLAISNARIAATIKKGVKGEMPTFTRKYDDAQISALIAYLRSFK